ncbi:hypothetical protein AB4Z48_06150 [Cupriavidus sp. 2TAF22]|uniref:hypothetical protein n=1 Tax=unclassified Cupriavidus TaxID=2640874 RepID=UPI003F90FDE5
MKEPIIDASGTTLQQYLQQHARGKAIRRYVWYRLVRPVVLASIWVAAAFYIYWCVVSAGSTEFSLKEIVPDALTILGMGLVFTVWTLVRRLEKSEVDPMRKARTVPGSTLDLAKDVVLSVGTGRRLVAYHDEDGLVSHVAQLQREAA